MRSMKNSSLCIEFVFGSYGGQDSYDWVIAACDMGRATQRMKWVQDPNFWTPSASDSTVGTQYSYLPVGPIESGNNPALTMPECSITTGIAVD